MSSIRAENPNLESALVVWRMTADEARDLAWFIQGYDSIQGHSGIPSILDVEALDRAAREIDPDDE